MIRIKIGYKDGKHEESFKLSKDLVSIGRDPGNDIIVDELSVSRFHCRLERSQDGEWRIKDAGSSNGIFMNGERLQEAVVLPGRANVFHIGDVELDLTVDDVGSEKTRSIDVSKFRARRWQLLKNESADFYLVRIFGFYLYNAAFGFLRNALLNPDPDRPGELFLWSLYLVIGILLLAGVLSVVSKVNHGAYRFRNIYSIIAAYFVIVVPLSELLDILTGQFASNALQQWVDRLSSGALLVWGIVKLMKEIFPSVSRVKSVGFAACLFCVAWFGPALVRAFQKEYVIFAETPPRVSYPLLQSFRKNSIEGLLQDMDKARPEIGRERARNLKLR